MNLTSPIEENVEHTQKMNDNKRKATALFIRGKYKEVCDFVDGIYGWEPGDLKRDYSQEEAQRCLTQL
jgi:hypothetical protein